MPAEKAPGATTRQPWKPGRVLWILVAFSAACFLMVIAFLFRSAGYDPSAIEHATRRSGVRSLNLLRGNARRSTADAVQVPVVPEGPIEQWNGWTQIPQQSDWDFFGLKIPNNTAKSRVRKGDVRADYDVNRNLSTTQRPKGYEYGDNPAFRYPDQFDRLFWVVSLKPFALYFPQIATEAEVDRIVAEAEPKLIRSQVALTKDGQKRKESGTQEVRTSKSTWVSFGTGLEQLEQRVTNITGTKWHEPMNVLRYERLQHYDAHHDYFDPSMYGKQSTNRMATLFVWLADTEQGGWTTLPRANGGRHPANYKHASCNQGLQCKPRKGAGVLFYDMKPDRSLDPFSLHGACDVEEGRKWGGAIWFRANTPGNTGGNHAAIS
eukprot:Hpha_TRINITY_DN13736_c0_g1::TRINITY_DN13736_c0_g1_i1::g.142504::m.142504/K00472/P4HA; prolyl 4-hydroxylase